METKQLKPMEPKIKWQNEEGRKIQTDWGSQRLETAVCQANLLRI